MAASRVYTHRRPAGLAIAAGMLTAVAAWVAASGPFDGIDRELFRAIDYLPEWLHRPLWILQLLGVLAAPLPVAVVAAGMRRFRLAGAALSLIPAKLVVEYGILKALVDRPRPGAWISGAVLRDVPTAGAAFPSGHAVILFGTATLIGLYLGRRYRLAVFALATTAAIARVYLGAHTPLDVVGGAAAGVAVAALLGVVFGVPVPATEADRPLHTRPTALSRSAGRLRWCRGGGVVRRFRSPPGFGEGGTA